MKTARSELASVALLHTGYRRIEELSPLLALCLRTLVLLAVFMVLEKFLFDFLRLSEEEYARPVLLLTAIGKMGLPGALVIAVAAALLARYGNLLAPWSALEMGRETRLFVVFLAVLVAWPLTTYGYNYYYDQGHYLDRLLLLLAVFLTWRRPVFIYLYLVLAFAILWQFDVPHLNYGSHTPHKTQLLHVLCMFAAVMLLHAVTRSPRTDDFFFLSCCLVAAAYWQPALTKLQLSWISHGQLYNMPLAAYANGWMPWLPAEFVVRFAGLVSHFDGPMLLLVLVIEVGCLLFLFRRMLSMLLLASLIVFHLGVFLLYGYFFWTWILLDAALLVILYRDLRRRQIGIYSTPHFLVSAVLVALAAHWCFPSSLGWYDTRLSYTYRYQAVGVSGETYDVPARFFAPYGDVFTMAPFGYLVEEHRSLVTPYATTGSAHNALGLMKSTTPEQVFALEESLGQQDYSPRRRARYSAFLERYLVHRNEGDKEPAWLRLFRSPPQFWSFGRGHVYSGQEPLQNVRVREITTLFDGQQLREIRAITVLEIPLAAASP